MTFERLAGLIRASAEVEYPRVPTLKRRCMIVSFALFEAARRSGLVCRIVGGWYVSNPPILVPPLRFGDIVSIAMRDSFREKPKRDRHCWVERKEEIWDLTRTQYGDFDKVFRCALPSGYYFRDFVDERGETTLYTLRSCGIDGREEAKRIAERALASKEDAA